MYSTILIADSLHVNPKNFTSFIEFTTSNKIKTHFESSNKDWISLYGCYESKLDVLFDKIEILSRLDNNMLFNYRIFDKALFALCRAEILSLVASNREWYSEKYPQGERAIFDKLYKNNRTILLQNMAAAWYWVDFWKRRLKELPIFDFCCVFSGSLIYQRSLIEILKNTPTKVILMESLFTGNEYYCEENYSHIANNSNIKHTAVYKNYLNKISNMDGDSYDRERMKAINKLILSKNRNVTQPDTSEEIKFNNKNPIISIIGQVVNDFSVLEYRNNGMSTIDFYTVIIKELITVGFNVIFKTHPWEMKKNNICKPLTKNILTEFIHELPKSEQDRIRIVDNYNIKKMFSYSDWIVGLNSQGLIEAAFEGFKPIQFGDAFYGRKGFTTDYSLEQISLFVNDLKSGSISGTLSLSEFNDFELFLVSLLQFHTVSIHKSGNPKLREIFSLPNVISLVNPHKTSNIKKPIVPKPEKNATNNKHAIMSKTEGKTSPKNDDIPIAKQDNTVNVRSDHKGNDIIVDKKKENAKFRKFKRDPWQFFADSNNSGLRLLRHLFKEKN